ncbi:MAG: alpha/beta hydrolase [Chloroflexota bacterium]
MPKASLAVDPHLFSLDAIDPATRAFNAQLASLLAGVPPIWTVPPAATRAAREEGRGPFGPIPLSPMAIDRIIGGPNGPLKVRTLLPPSFNAVYLHLHGGGWTLGAPHHSDVVLEELVRAAGVGVVSVDYRLAPEHPYPAGPDDCEAAALWLVEHAESEFGTTRLLIGGESAGAHLAVVTMLRLRDKHHIQPFSRANLVFGAYDLAGTPSVALGTDTLVLNRQSTRWFTDNFVTNDKRHDPDVSPLRADLRQLPAALFSVGTLDPLLDDTLFMHARWVAAGNSAELAIYPGGVHCFTSYDFALARAARARSAEFLAA